MDGGVGRGGDGGISIVGMMNGRRGTRRGITIVGMIVRRLVLVGLPSVPTVAGRVGRGAERGISTVGMNGRRGTGRGISIVGMSVRRLVLVGLPPVPTAGRPGCCATISGMSRFQADVAKSRSPVDMSLSMSVSGPHEQWLRQ